MMTILFPKEQQQQPSLLTETTVFLNLNSMIKTTTQKLTQQAMSGRIAPILSKLILSRQDIAAIGQAIAFVANPVDLFVLFFFGLATVPIVRVLYVVYTHATSLYYYYSSSSSETSEELKVKHNKSDYELFRDSYAYQIAEHLSQAARIGLLVYLADCIDATVSVLGFQTEEYYRSHVFAKLLYTVWATRRFIHFKTHVLYEYVVKINPESEKKINHINHLLDGCIYAGMVFSVADLLSVEMGVAMTSVFAFGSIGTLVFSLASKDIATQAINGLTLTVSDRMSEGELVRFGDGTAGRVMKIGWLETKIRTYDDLILTIPNTQLGTQRVINLSRLKMCRVKPYLRFRFSDADKVPKVLNYIKEEIKKSCPELISDGSRPFRAVWIDYKEDHLETFVDCHFNLPPIGTQYWENRQRVMEAINRVLKRNAIELFTAVYPKLELDDKLKKL